MCRPLLGESLLPTAGSAFCRRSVRDVRASAEPSRCMPKLRVQAGPVRRAAGSSHVRGRRAGPAGRERAFDDQVSAGQLVALAAWPRQGGGADIPAVCPVLAWAAFGDAVLVLVRAGEA